MSNQLATTNQHLPAPRPSIYEPSTLDESMMLAERLAKSNLTPRQLRNPADVFVVLAYGDALGLKAMQALQQIHVIDGKPSLSADLIVGLVKRSPVCEYFMLVESTAESATFKTQRRGEPEPTSYTYSIADAKRAGLLGKRNWQQHPAAMLRARCSAALARAVYQDVAGGLYDPDELDNRDVAPDAVPLQPAPEIYRITPASPVKHRTVIEAIEALDAPGWLKRALVREVEAEHLSWMGDRIPAKALADAGYTGPGRWLRLRRDLEAGTLAAVPNVGPAAIEKIRAAFEEADKHPPILEPPYEAEEEDVIDAEFDDGAELQDEIVEALVTSRAWWAERQVRAMDALTRERLEAEQAEATDMDHAVACLTDAVIAFVEEGLHGDHGEARKALGEAMITCHGNPSNGATWTPAQVLDRCIHHAQLMIQVASKKEAA